MRRSLVLLAMSGALLLTTLFAVRVAEAGNRRAIGFGGGAYACTGCHGLPPVSQCDAPTAGTELVEDYLGGGGVHRTHVAFLAAKLGITGTDTCVPCHGANPGSAAWHDEGAGTVLQVNVDLVDGAANFGTVAIYNGTSVEDGSGFPGTPNAKGGEPQRCENLNCHGPGAAPWELDLTGPSSDDPRTKDAIAGALRWDQMCIDGASTEQAKIDAGRANACAGCHASRGMANFGEPDTSIVVGAYTSALGSQGATASYFGTPSGYSRGGHGDRGIQTEDPFVDSDPGNATPLYCTSCHSGAEAHFPPPSSGNIHRLTITTLENDDHTSAGLCNSCHDGADYHGGVPSTPVRNHHPSYYTYVGGGHLVAPENGYTGPGTLDGDPDFFVDFWSDPGEPPVPAPTPYLPLEKHLLGTGSSTRSLCVTCHNPHGTDLYVYNPGALPAEDIPDNNMLRLRDSDNTLCDVCH